MRFGNFVIILFILAIPSSSFGQDIELFQQFNGRYDYTAIGNTLNPNENNIDDSFCIPLESSSANLSLSTDNTIIAAYLYWAGSGPGDPLVTLNGISIEAEDTYTVEYEETSGILTYFSCYADITDFIINEGNIAYTLSDLDISEPLTNFPRYCINRTNFAGWSIYVVFQNDNLPLNQINLYQGLEIINSNNQEKIIQIDNLNVIDNTGAKIGFLAWEGDNNLNFGESLSFNGNVLANPPLNLSDNAFNGTNTFTNSNTFYNADLDVYDIQDNISVGDTNASIKMTTGIEVPGGIIADLIILNNIITVLNSQLPDATIIISDYTLECGNRQIDLEYTVFNTNSTEFLPANTPIALYVNDELIGQTSTQNNIPINGFETGTTQIFIPENFGNSLVITLVVDDDGTGASTVIETNETNNNFDTQIELLIIPPIEILPNLISCNEGFNSAEFDLSEVLELNDINTSSNVSFHTSLSELQQLSNAILAPENFTNTSNPQSIYIRIENPPCYNIYAFDIMVENCPPHIPEGFSPNDDSTNDWFNIQGLYNIFENHQLKIYNRYGTLIFEGNNDLPWNGLINRGLNNHGKLVPVGTYFYVINFNDPQYKSEIGWVYVNY